MNKVSLRVFLLTLLGVFVLGITEAVASSSNRSYASAMLRSDAPTGSGKVYVGANATSSPNYQTSSSYESSNTTSTFHFYAQATTGYVFTGWYDKSADAGYTAIAQSTVDEVTYSYKDEHYVMQVTNESNSTSQSTKIYLYAGFLKIVQLSFLRPEYGSFTISHNDVIVEDYGSFTVDGLVKLSATPDENCIFYGWYTTTDDGVTRNYFSSEEEIEPSFTSDVTIGAEFLKILSSGTCGAEDDNITWTLYSNGVLLISGTGAMADYTNSIPWEDWYDSIKQIIVSDGITYIGARAFERCTTAETITLGKDITGIGEYACYIQGGKISLLTCNAQIPPALGSEKTINGGYTIYVPCASLSAYKSSWSSFNSDIHCEGEAYTIRFVNYDGTELQSGEVEYGVVPEYSGAIPAKPADVQYTYNFAGWTPEIVAVTEEATYTAVFDGTLNKLLITWQDEDGNPIAEDLVDYGTIPVYGGDTPTKESDAEYSYEFVGWLPKIKPATEVVRYVTDFDKHKLAPETVYTVNINGENCSLNISNECPAGTTLTVEAVADECFEFQKWSDNETANPRTITVTEDADLTAEFNKVRYTITGKTENGGGKVQIVNQ